MNFIKWQKNIKTFAEFIAYLYLKKSKIVIFSKEQWTYTVFTSVKLLRSGQKINMLLRNFLFFFKPDDLNIIKFYYDWANANR